MSEKKNNQEKKLKPLITDFDREDPLAKTVKQETQRASQALRDYAFMGSRRSLRALLAQYLQDEKAGRIPPTNSFVTISQWSVMFMWQDRIAVWDELERKREQDEFIETQSKWRQRRRELAQGAFAKIAQALQNVEIEGQTMRDVANAIKIINQELRIEYQDENKLEDGTLTITQTGVITPTIIKIIRPEEDDQQ